MTDKCVCGGFLDKENPIFFQTGLFRREKAFACPECGRIYWFSGKKVEDSHGELLFLVDGTVRFCSPSTSTGGIF